MIELSEMGTTILAAPAMKKAREELKAELYFAIFKKNVGSLELLGTFPPANVFTIRDTSIATLIVDTLKFLLWTRKNSIDTVIDLELFSRFTALLTGFSGASRRVGYYRFHNEGLYRGEMLTHRVSYNPHIHIAQNLIALVNALLAPSPQIPYSKTPVIEADLTVSLPAPNAAARETMIARIRARVPSRSGRASRRADQSECQRTPAASALDAGALRRIDQAHPEAIPGRAGADHRRAERARGSRGIGERMRAALRLARGPYRAVRIAGALLARESDGDE